MLSTVIVIPSRCVCTSLNAQIIVHSPSVQNHSDFPSTMNPPWPRRVRCKHSYEEVLSMARWLGSWIDQGDTRWHLAVAPSSNRSHTVRRENSCGSIVGRSPFGHHFVDTHKLKT
jgi:hypothetical protein